jgi:hypothetical protein
MVLNLIKVASMAGLVVLTLGVIPNRRWGSIIAVVTCIAVAFVLHFAAL